MTFSRVFMATISSLAIGSAVSVDAQDRASAPSACSPAAAELKALAVRTRADHPDLGDFVRTLDAAVGADSTYLNEHSVVVLSDQQGLEATLMFPYAAYRLALFETLRKRDPIDGVEILPGVVINIAPSSIDAPNIVKVIVERDGKEVTPISNNVKPTALETRTGARSTLHAGAAIYPCSAFALGGRVRVTLIPERGRNIERDLKASDLALFTTQQTDVLAASLLKATSKDVEARIGKPVRIEGSRWTYEVEGKKLFVYVSESGIVVDVQPQTFDLTTLKK